MASTTLPHDNSAQVAGEPLSLGEKAFDIAQQPAFSFKPLSNIKQALCALHPYATDSSRAVPAFHYCTHSISSDLHQCVIFDSNEPTARLIGVEYIISEKVFKTLDDEEKKLWHSHKYEIESGILTMIAKQGIPGGIDSALEMPALKDLHTTYGKTWHFWQIDKGHTLPLGLPNLMKSFNGPDDVKPEWIKEHEDRVGIKVQDKAEYRAKHLNTSYQVLEGADAKGPDDDPTDFWFDVLQIVDDIGTLNKELSLQVPGGTGSASGSMPFVFVRTGSHLIRGTTAESPNGFFNSTIPITAVAANSSTPSPSSCAPTFTTTVTTTGARSASHVDSSVVIGATIGSIVPTVIILAILSIFCIQRRARKPEPTSISLESPKRASNAFSSVFARLTGSSDQGTTVTPFIQIPDPASSPSNPHASLPQGHFSSHTGSSSYHPPPSYLGEKIVALQSQSEHLSPHTTDISVTELSQISQIQSTQTVNPKLQETNASSTERQQLLEEEAGRLRLQIMGMVNSALSSGANLATAENDIQLQNENRQMVAEMQRMKQQIEMLEQDRESLWARGLSDEPPSYLTSIGR
ncbi:hypothetical protein GYMLUDRAFT_243410 [Collybiopsis luxurians FD-317 M1]|uniref:DUF1264-domain-containing protein n=1 Tax=Collybiopsis luxurians FD-317 M1 TaxID=944289 RepID=A0A0D0BDE2_9AGAR|nr:hypothetical protein GYMLUDRAFT_243410 [Collybiopsis luxurians FD-317 M1]